jgi:hypothetical protein
MKTVTVTDATTVVDVLPRDAREGVVLMRDGHAVALVVPFDDEEMLWYVREHDPEFIESIARGREEAARGETTRLDDFKRELEAEEAASKAP